MAGKKGRSGRRTNEEERKLEALLTKSYDYLNNNFGKFPETTRIHIALTLIAKRVPSEMTVKGESVITHRVEIIDIEERSRQLVTSIN